MLTRLRISAFLLFWGLALIGCQSLPFSHDQAAEFNDKTLLMTGCRSGLGQGFMVCKFVEGAPIESSFIVILPLGEKSKLAEIRIRQGDNLHIQTTESAINEIAFSKFMPGKTWGMEHDGPMQILVTVKGSHSPIKVLGYAYVVVLKKGYNPLPLSDENYLMNTVKCTLGYSLHGQSTVQCHE